MIPDIPGHKAPPEILSYLQDEVALLLGRRNRGFPGAQPVSFARRHLQELCERDYYLCEKTDGIRCLLYCSIDSNEREVHYLIDRKNDFYLINDLHFPRMGDKTFQSFHEPTLLDGELVVDTVKDRDGTTTHRLRYLVFDCIVLDKDPLMDRRLDIRLGKLRSFFMEPHKEFCRAFPQFAAKMPFEVMAKHMDVGYVLSYTFKEKLPRLEHGNDGLIFTCKDTPYVFGTDEHIIKWKPPHENTIDFKLDLVEDSFPLYDPMDGGGPVPDYDAMPTFRLLVNHGNNEHVPFESNLFLTPEDWDAMKSLNEILDGRIIECYRTAEGKWRFKAEPDGTPRFRDDKKEANHISTVRKVLDSIADGVTEKELLEAERSIRAAWKMREEETKKRKAGEQLGAGMEKRVKEAA